MVCIKRRKAIICRMSQSYRLRLRDGRYVFMDWHIYCGPTLYFDRAQQREVAGWWFDEAICEAVDWFVDRGERA